MTTQAEAYAIYKDDYLYHDRVEDVTIYWAAGGTQANVKAKQELPSESLKQHGEGVADTSVDCRWVVWDTTLGGNLLHENDVLQRSTGERWRIKSASWQLFNTQWHVDTKKDR